MARDDNNTAIYIAFEDHDPNDPALPEKNLLRAILLTAMSDLKKEGDSCRKATEYFLSTEEDYIFSFRSVCNFLDIDAEQVLVVTGLKQGRAGERPQPKKPEAPVPEKVGPDPLA